MVELRVSLPPGGDASYRVVVGVGALATLPDLLARDCPAERYAVIADANVAGLYGESVVERLRAVGASAGLFPFPAGETHKTRGTWIALCDALLEARYGRDAAIVALGGGVTGDVAGFVAATYLRGIPFIQVPTSTLAMIDASVGGKTGVDTAAGKNLIGAFHQPRLVVADTETLRTLPETALADGLAEAVKHGAIADAAYLDELEAGAAALLARDAATLERAVARSVEIKASFVAADPTERGQRAVLNFGHTVAHALEAASQLAIPHGAAVAIGMVVEARLGEAIGRAASGTAARLAAVLHRFGLPYAMPAGAAPAAILDFMRADKKVRAGALRFSLPSALGAFTEHETGGWTTPVPDAIVTEGLAEGVAAAGS